MTATVKNFALLPLIPNPSKDQVQELLKWSNKCGRLGLVALITFKDPILDIEVVCATESPIESYTAYHLWCNSDFTQIRDALILVKSMCGGFSG